MEVMDEREMLSEKIRTIYTRNKARDLYDLYRLLSRNVKIDMDLVNHKLERYGISYFEKDFIEKCVSLKTYWEMELGSLMELVPSFDAVLEEVRQRLV